MGVFVPFWQGGLNLRLVALVVSIQPFAYVVANYTCHDRNNESNKYIHRKVRAPSLCRYRGGNKINYSIIYFKSKRQKFYLHKCNFRSKIYFVVRRVAQFGRALRSGRRGRRFKSCHLDQLRICFDRSFFVVMHSLSVLYWNRKNRAERG